MKNFHVLIILFFMVISVNTGAQNFTKQQMLEDFDFLYEKLDSVNTRFPIIKAVTGIDILSDIRKIRQKIDVDTTICDSVFYDCLYRAMIACKDMHISYVSGYPYKDYDEAYIQEAKKNTIAFSRSSVVSRYETSYNPFQVYYINGEYYATSIYENDYTNTEIIPRKAKLLKVNDISFDEYVEKWMVPIIENPRWDKKNKKYYVGTIISPQRTGQSNEFRVTYSYNGKIKEVDIKSYKIKFANSKGGYDPKVFYFEKDKILYIRIPRMDSERIENYKKALLKFKNKKINKVMIDVRGNGGGSDSFWLNLIEMIIEKSVPYPQTLAFRNNELVIKYLNMNKITYKDEEVKLNHLKIGDNEYFYTIEDSPTSIDPAENSLRYGGPIYVLIDDKIFSSTLAFTAVCQNADQLITVGTPSGYFGGQGVMPLYFILPNTKLLFRVEYSLDCTNVNGNNMIEYFHDEPEIPVELTLDDIFNIRDSAVELYDEYFLYNIDPTFRKVLDLP